jgi:hypothetical protein
MVKENQREQYKGGRLRRNRTGRKTDNRIAPDGGGFVSVDEKLCYMCRHVRWKRERACGTGEVGCLWEIGQLISDMGPDGSGSRHAMITTTQSKRLFAFAFLRVLRNYIASASLYDTVHIFLLCRLKINHMRELSHLCLFLDLLVWS